MENVKPLTEPEFDPLMFHVAPASGPISVSVELALPMKLPMFANVPPMPGGCWSGVFTVIGLARWESSSVFVPPPPLTLPETLSPGKYANLSLPRPPARFSKEENVKPFTAPEFDPLTFHVAPASGPISVSVELPLPMKLPMFANVPPMPVAVSVWRLTVTGPARLE